MTMVLDAASASLTGKRAHNDDVCLITTPSSERVSAFGALLAIADGVGGLPEGDRAARAAVDAFRDSYYASPETWGLERALRLSMEAANGAVISLGHGGATTLSALLLRNRGFAIAHVGDTRVWLYRERQLKALTRGHQRPHRDIGTVLTRACGFDDQINTDVSFGELAEGDIFLLTSDGVHEVLNSERIADALAGATSMQALADELVQQALAHDGSDNASVCAVRVAGLPAATASDVGEAIAHLPVRAVPAVGTQIDGFRIDAQLHAGRMSLLFKAVDLESQETVVLKFPNPQHADDARFIDCFLREEWIGRRIDSPYIAKALSLKPGRRSQLYAALVYYEGETLAQRIKRRHGLNVTESLHVMRQLLTGLDHLHRKGVIHRDVKPENILLDARNHLRLLDLGVSRVERLSEEQDSAPVGTPSYMAPELIGGAQATEATDVYAAGVTLYQMLTERFPYGEIEPFSHPKFARPVPPDRYNPELPSWVSLATLKACAADPRTRFAHAADFQAALASAAANTASRIKLPLLERVPPEHWKTLFILSAVANLILAVLLAR